MILMKKDGQKIMINDEGLHTYKTLLYNTIMRLKQVEENLNHEQTEELENAMFLFNQLPDEIRKDNEEKKHSL